jgi:hypothetical protein
MALNKAKAISVLSTEYVQVRVSTTLNGLPYDVTDGTVEFAFVSNGESPTVGDWTTAEWETAGPDYYGRILVGPEGAVTLAAGSYESWIRVTIDPQTLVEPTGSVLIY